MEEKVKITLPGEEGTFKNKKNILIIALSSISFLLLILVIYLLLPKKVNNTSTLTKKIPASESKITSSYVVVDTNQRSCFDDQKEIPCTSSGQDGQYLRNAPRYQNNNDGTITDLNSGLMWLKNAGEKKDYYQALQSAKGFEFAGYSDWRVPTIKELYSLIDFSGEDLDPVQKSIVSGNPFIDNDYFDFNYGDVSKGDRVIDSQWITSNVYRSKVMNNQECFFGVNFADGRIKCYPTQKGGNNGYYLRLVRGNTYGINNFVDNKNGTVNDKATNLMWQQNDSGKAIGWADAINYCETLSLAGYSNWRLPNAKELQSIVDYSKSPDTTNSPAIDSVFNSTSITNEINQKDWGFYWSSTTHLGVRGKPSEAVYVSFGRALGKMNGRILDVHGAGAQRSDPKVGNINDYPQYFGPQGDVRRLYNFARCVRDSI